MSPFVIPILALLIPMIIVPVALGLKHAKLLRELEHAERMKALELGRTLPQDEPFWSPPKICVAIGAGVPIGVFFCAFLASQMGGRHEEVWVMAGFVGIAGVISGSVLASKYFNQRHLAESSNPYASAKPTVDADEFDVVSARG
jgi:hypothetical protein